MQGQGQHQSSSMKETMCHRQKQTMLLSYYCRLLKERPCTEHPTCKSAKEGVGALSTVSAFNHERVPTSC